MTTESDLWTMEEKLWLDGAEAARSCVGKDAVMIFPYPAGILQGREGTDSITSAPRWRTVLMDDRAVTLRGNVAVLAYRASAEREGEALYHALCASTYVDDGDGWLLISHQQTPVSEASEVEAVPKAG